jgi:hypothetical protein
MPSDRVSDDRDQPEVALLLLAPPSFLVEVDQQHSLAPGAALMTGAFVVV